MSDHRILIIADIQSVHTVRWASSLSKRGWDVTVLSVTAGSLDGVRVLHSDPGQPSDQRLVRWGKQLIFLLRQLWAQMTGKYDIVHVHFLRADLIPVIATWHPVSVISLWGSDVKTAEEGAYTRWERFPRYALLNASAVTATNDFLASRGKQKAGQDVTVKVIPFGVDQTEFYSAQVNRKQNAVITFCFGKGSLIKTYAPDILLTAFARVVKQLPNAHLLMTGAVVDDFGLETVQMVETLGLKDKVTLLGRLNHKEMLELYRKSDIYVQASRWESFGVAGLEALACGTAVIVTYVGGVGSLFTDRENALIVQPNDPIQLATAMLELAVDHRLRMKLIENGQKMVQDKYNWEDNVSQMILLYNNILQGKPIG